jgi:isopenicillin-N N-acyltransferase like protein
MTQGLRVVDVAGSPREIGTAHGEELREVIAEGIERWPGRDEKYVDTFLASTDFVKAIESFTPSLLDEVRGIAEGSRQRFETVLAYQMMDEEWAHRVSASRARTASVEACSAFGALREDGSALVAQNMDLPSHYDGTQVVLRVRPVDSPAVLVFTPAGLIGTTGLNQEGVGVCVNALAQLRHSQSGLPVGFVLRGILERTTAEDAARFVRTVPHATGQNYLLGGPRDLYDFEASPSHVAELIRDGAQLMHTNHVLASDDIDPQVRDDPRSTSVARLERLRRDLGESGSGVSVEAVKGALSDREVPVCVPRGSDWMTLGSVVMELAEEPLLHVAPGPPIDTPYEEVRFA